MLEFDEESFCEEIDRRLGGASSIDSNSFSRNFLLALVLKVL